MKKYIHASDYFETDMVDAARLAILGGKLRDDIIFVSQIVDETSYGEGEFQSDLSCIVEIGRFIIDGIGAIYVEYYVYKDGTIEFNDSGCMLFIDGNGDWVDFDQNTMDCIHKFIDDSYGEQNIKNMIEAVL